MYIIYVFSQASKLQKMLLSTTLCLSKMSTCEWTHTVQPRVGHGSTVSPLPVCGSVLSELGGWGPVEDEPEFGTPTLEPVLTS